MGSESKDLLLVLIRKGWETANPNQLPNPKREILP
jgi:hypothetical protein